MMNAIRLYEYPTRNILNTVPNPICFLSLQKTITNISVFTMAWRFPRERPNRFASARFVTVQGSVPQASRSNQYTQIPIIQTDMKHKTIRRMMCGFLYIFRKKSFTASSIEFTYNRRLKRAL